ncbi:hypothetical protein T484DRAFT_1875049 [Baffinella frigidus]|nr:hypothetical protein T484DRAFT_1875049 [Cryptophyta sp. CCMP2293]
MVGATTTDRAFADHVARAVISTYDSLPKNGKPASSEWTILAGIVAARPRRGVKGVQGGEPSGGVAEEELEVVALATGSKCLSGVKLRKDGKVLNDSHAEVLARRAFIHLLQAQLHTLDSTQPLPASSNDADAGGAALSSQSLLLEWAPAPPASHAHPAEEAAGPQNPGAEGGGQDAAGRMARMAEGVTLHMYISQPPCGDACISPGGASGLEGAAGGDGAPAAKRLRVSTDDKRLVSSPRDP